MYHIKSINDETNICTENLTEDESDYHESLDPEVHLIRHLTNDEHNSDTVPVYIVTGGEEEGADYILDDTLGKFDYDQPHKSEEIYKEFAPDQDSLNKAMLSIDSHPWKLG